MESVSEQFLKKLEYMKNKYAKKMLLTKKSEAEYENPDQKMCDVFNQRVGNLNVADGYNCEKCKNRGGFMRLSENGNPVFRACSCMNAREMIKNLKDSGLADYIKKYTFDKYNATKLWQKEIKKSATDFVKDAENKWFFIGGQSGVGKTHICTAITAEFLKQGKKAHYMLWRDEITELKTSITDVVFYKKTMHKLKTVEVLYIDDFLKNGKEKDGSLQKPSPAEINIIFEILNSRYNSLNLFTIISSERLLSEIKNIDWAVGRRIEERCGKKYVCEIKPDKSKTYRS